MGILADIFDEERRHLSERIGDGPPEKAVRIFPIGREGSRRLPMLSRIIALVLASVAYSSPAWATPYWQTISREIAAETYANGRFLYTSRPDVRTCNPGALSQQAKDRALRAMNQIRALHGLSPVKYSYLYDRSVQEAALIQAANGYPGHHPSRSARCYTTAGDEGSGSSNLSGTARRGQTFIERDPVYKMISWTHDARNRSLVAAAGHRRWMLDPFAAYLSYGHVYGHTVQKTFDFDREPAVTPFITVDYVAFPYKTYPAILMQDDPPWSFSVIEDKTKRGNNKHPYFQLAAVTVTRSSDGARLPVGKLHMDAKGYGVPNFLSWRVRGWEYDTPYQVTIRNVALKQTRQFRTYSYQVTINRTSHQPAPPPRTVQRKQEQKELTFPAPQQRIITREEREREARAAARAKKRLEQATRR